MGGGLDFLDLVSLRSLWKHGLLRALHPPTHLFLIYITGLSSVHEQEGWGLVGLGRGGCYRNKPSICFSFAINKGFGLQCVEIPHSTSDAKCRRFRLVRNESDF